MRARTALRSALLLVLGASLLAGCSAGAGGSTGSGSSSAPATPSASNPPSPAGGPSVGNRTFVSTGVTGHRLVAGTTVTLAFRDATLAASAGCNTMSGEYHIAGATLAVGDMAMTQMGCQADRMAQDDWLAKLLPGATVQFGDASLTVSKGDISIAFVDRQTTNLRLEGTTWSVVGLVNGDTVSSFPGVTATLVVRGVAAAVDTGCNWGSIPVTVAEGKITFGPVSMTARGCANEADTMERAVLAVMAGTQPYRIDGNSLTIGGGGRAGLMFTGTKAAPSPDPADVPLAATPRADTR
jgi:heat shock protein HslJ